MSFFLSYINILIVCVCVCILSSASFHMAIRLIVPMIFHISKYRNPTERIYRNIWIFQHLEKELLSQYIMVIVFY